MAHYTPIFKDLFPKAAVLFSAAEDNSRIRCSSALASSKPSSAERSAAVHIAAESGSYEALDFMLQSFAKAQQQVKFLDATCEIVQNDPALAEVIRRYRDKQHSQTIKIIETAHKLTLPTQP